jgi:hypothetical protein
MRWKDWRRFAMEKIIDCSPQFARVSSSRGYECRVVISFGFNDGSMVVISGRSEAYKKFNSQEM